MSATSRLAARGRLPLHNLLERGVGAASPSPRSIMRILQVLSVTVLTVFLFVSTDVAAHTKISAATSQSTPNWGDELTDSTGNGIYLLVDANTAEERANLLSKFSNNLKVRWWLETGMTNDYVMGALKLKGLTGSALTENKNYKYFLKFAKTAETYRLNKWLRRDVTTYQAWKELGMQEFRNVQQLNQIKNTEEFRIYKRYVNEFDDYVVETMKASYNPPKLMVSRDASDAEMTARVQIMVESKRPEEYAKVALGLIVPGKRGVITLKGDALKNHEDYKYFELFLEQVASVAAKTN